MPLLYKILFAIIIVYYSSFAQEQTPPEFAIPKQEEPSASPVVDDEVELLNIGKTTNLTSLLSEIRKLSLDGEYKLAEKMASTALAKIDQTEENRFYLRQIRKEETKLLYQQAQLALNKDFSLASRFLSVTAKILGQELSERKIEREVKSSQDMSKDASLGVAC